ncbi:MAG TPA: hypothetical protein VM537_27285 [Anaerolineae bacterium]|nr:hypothetical protein [Anaerolineae bacterium]
MEEKRWFVTVDLCNLDRRGVFCNRVGQTSSSEAEHSQKEMHDMLGPFWLILAPISVQLTADELAAYKFWRPLAEYSNGFGIASTVDDVPPSCLPEQGV